MSANEARYKGFSHVPVELGPEFIHGEKENLLLDYLNKHGVAGKPNATTMQLKWPNYFYFGKEGKLVSGKDSEDDKELTRMLDTFEMTGEMDADLIPDESLLQYMARMGTSSRLIDMADAIFANDYGNEASKIGLKEVVHEQDSWKYGEDYLVLDGCSFSDIVNDMAKGLDVRTSWKAKEVLHSGPCGRCRVVRDNGDSIQADRIIITVPLNILRDGDILFKPPLPADKVQAAAVVQQSNCVKVILRLKEVFWPADCWDVVCSDSLIPEIWLTPAAQVLKGIPMKEYYMVGFVAGERATRLAALPADELARKMCLQLDAIFGSPQNPTPCSIACTGFLVQDWSKEPLAKGAYSHPSLGAYGKRDALRYDSRSCDSRSFWPVYQASFDASASAFPQGIPIMVGLFCLYVRSPVTLVHTSASPSASSTLPGRPHKRVSTPASMAVLTPASMPSLPLERADAAGHACAQLDD